jgi:hypothetical protein
VPTLRENLVLHLSIYGNIIQVYGKHRNRLLLVWLPLSSTNFILYYGHMTFDLHPLLQECSWGIKQDLGIVTCDTEELVVFGLLCVFLELVLTALFFRVTYCPHLQSLCSIHASALCFWVPLGGTWEHKALAWVGYKLLRWGDMLPHGVYYSKFLDFFFQLGKNTQWIMDGFALGRTCARFVDIDHSCTKAPWVYCKSGLHGDSARRGFRFQQSYKMNLRYNFYFSLHFLHTNS